MMTAHLTRTLGYIWLVVLGLALLVSAAGAYERAMQVQEYAKGCDAFGYLQMAKEVRRAAAQRRYPNYHLETPQTRSLIDFLQSQDVPVTGWNELVAPQAHHYFPEAGSVGVQYPPGTGLLLALFPEGTAGHGLNRTIIGLFLIVGLGVLIAAGRTQSWAAAGGVVFALQFGLEILGGMGDFSYSINAMLIPLLLSLLALFMALVLQAGAGKPWLAWGMAFFSGGCFGFAILVRLPILLLLPGMLLLLAGAGWRNWINGSVLAFCAGVVLVGVVPLLHHQQQVAGAWYLSTYGPGDNAPPTLAVLNINIPYYLGGGHGTQYFWAPLTALVGFAGLVLRTGKPGGKRFPLSGRRVVVAVLVLWAIPTVYFLTHRPLVPYYPHPASFAAVVILALGGFALARAGGEGVRRGPWQMLAVAAALLPGLVGIERAWAARPQTPGAAVASPRRPPLAPELTDGRAWVLADLLSGTFWYDAQKPAYKILFSDPSTRVLMYRFIFGRGEPLYVVRDCEEIQYIMNEIEELGGTLEQRGEVDRYPYFLVHWPEKGPH